MSVVPLVSIFIRTLNEEELLDECLKQIFKQLDAPSFEVIILDCESNDRTVEIAQKYPCRIFSIPRKLFSYSRALNFGAAVAQGEFFVPLSGHAIPVNEHWLNELLKPLISAPAVAASFSKHETWDWASSQEIQQSSLLFTELAWTHSAEDFTCAVLDEAAFYKLCLFSNVSACIRRKVALQFPFREMPFSEDRAFALDCFAAGLAVSYAPLSRVRHAHRPRLREFRSVASKATLARAQLGVLQREILPSINFHPYQPSLAPLILKLPLLLAWIATQFALCRPTSTQQYSTACLGTLLGKIDASRALAAHKVTCPAPAKADQLLAIATDISNVERR